MLLMYMTLQEENDGKELIVPVCIIPYSTNTEMGKSIVDGLVEVLNMEDEDGDNGPLNDYISSCKYSVREITEQEAITFIKELNKIDIDKYL